MPLLCRPVDYLLGAWPQDHDLAVTQVGDVENRQFVRRTIGVRFEVQLRAACRCGAKAILRFSRLECLFIRRLQGSDGIGIYR